jgi:hypothetical protein
MSGATGKGWIGNKIKGYADTPMGPVIEKGDRVYIDFTKSFVWTIIGKRGFGKSYGVSDIIEEILDQNPTLGILIIDIMGIYFSLKYPNEKDGVPSPELRGWEKEVSPKSYADKVRVLVPEGYKDKYPAGTYDGVISIRPNQLTLQNWLDALRLQPTEPQGIVLSIFLKRIKELNPNFTLTQLTNLIQDVVTLDETPEDQRDNTVIDLSNEIHFRSTTIETLQSKLLSTETWGIFSRNALKISQLVKPGFATIIDLSWHEIPDSVGALLIGFLTERLYSLRKQQSISEMHEAIGESISTEEYEDIPPPVLVVEEAHNYLGKSRKTQFCVEGFKKYILQGRQAKCSLITITQQPQNLDTRPLSQIDGCIVMNLSHEQDLKAAQSIIPTVLPARWKDTIVGLKIGEGLIAYSNQKELIKFKFRPRRSIHLARTESTSMFDLKSIKSSTIKEEEEEDSTIIEPVEAPPVVSNMHELNEVTHLTADLVVARMKNERLRESKQQAVEELNNQTAELSNQTVELNKQLEKLTQDNFALTHRNTDLEKASAGYQETITKLQKVVDSCKVENETKGIMIAVFDQDRGYIPDTCSTASIVNETLLRDIARSAIGFGDDLKTLQFSIEKEVIVHCYTKRFIRQEDEARGFKILYSLVIFTSDSEEKFNESALDRIITKLIENWRNRNTILAQYFNQYFFSTAQLNQAVILYKMELDSARNRLRALIQRQKTREDLLRDQIIKLREEKQLLVTQITNLSEFLALDDDKLREIAIKEEQKRIFELSEELSKVKQVLDDERKQTALNLDEAKEVIRKLDLDLETTENRIRREIEMDLAAQERAEPQKMGPQIEERIGTHQAQAPIPQGSRESLMEFLESSGVMTIVDQLMKEEKVKNDEEIQDLRGAVDKYKEGIQILKNYIEKVKRNRDEQLIQKGMEANRLTRVNLNQEQEIAVLKRKLKDQRRRSAATLTKDEQEKIFSSDAIPVEWARSFNQESYPKIITEATQKLKQKITDLDPLAYKILSVLESLDVAIRSDNIDKLIIDWSMSSIYKRLDDLKKREFITQSKDGVKVFYKSNLRRLVLTTFKPFKSVLTDSQLEQIYLEIRSVLEIHRPSTPGSMSTLEDFTYFNSPEFQKRMQDEVK